MAELIFSKLLIQLLFTVGVIVCSGVLLAWSKRFFLRSCGSAGYHVQIVTGETDKPTVDEANENPNDTDIPETVEATGDIEQSDGDNTENKSE